MFASSFKISSLASKLYLKFWISIKVFYRSQTRCLDVAADLRLSAFGSHSPRILSTRALLKSGLVFKFVDWLEDWKVQVVNVVCTDEVEYGYQMVSIGDRGSCLTGFSQMSSAYSLPRG